MRERERGRGDSEAGRERRGQPYSPVGVRRQGAVAALASQVRWTVGPLMNRLKDQLSEGAIETVRVPRGGPTSGIIAADAFRRGCDHLVGSSMPANRTSPSNGGLLDGRRRAAIVAAADRAMAMSTVTPAPASQRRGFERVAATLTPALKADPLRELSLLAQDHMRYCVASQAPMHHYSIYKVSNRL